jgi:hypothetical protein
MKKFDQSKIRFQDFPREIRDLIYSNALPIAFRRLVILQIAYLHHNHRSSTQCIILKHWHRIFSALAQQRVRQRRRPVGVGQDEGSWEGWTWDTLEAVVKPMCLVQPMDLKGVLMWSGIRPKTSG